MYFSGSQKEFSGKGAYEKPSAREGHSQQCLRAGNKLAWAGSVGKALGWSMSDVQEGQREGLEGQCPSCRARELHLVDYVEPRKSL